MADQGSGGQQETAANEESMNLKAVMIGGTGAVGKHLVGELLKSKNFAKVVVLGRRNVTIPESFGLDQPKLESDGKLEQVTVDFETLTEESVGEHFREKDVFFTTMGTTRSQAGSADNFVKIDHGYTMKCAGIAKNCGIPQMSLLTSQGANANSWFLYMKTKGRIEEESKALGFDHLGIFRPGLLGRGNEMRFGEKVAAFFVSAIEVGDVAKGMRVAAESFAKGKAKEKVNTYGNAEIRQFCKEA